MTVYKSISDINTTISMALKRGTGTLKLSKKKCIRQLEIVLHKFGKEDPPARKKIPVELDVHTYLCIEGLEKEATDHEQTIGNWELIAF